jgi:hypothetical protein
MNNLPDGYAEFIDNVMQHLMDRDYKIVKVITIPVFGQIMQVNVCEVVGGKDDGLIFGKAQGTNIAILLDKKEYER